MQVQQPKEGRCLVAEGVGRGVALEKPSVPVKSEVRLLEARVLAGREQQMARACQCACPDRERKSSVVCRRI